MDFLKGGLNIALHIGIDFTSSNLEKTLPESLHYMPSADPLNGNGHPAQLNQYQQVILSAAEILLHYDNDQKVPVYGFGAIPPYGPRVVSHCFPCTFQDENVEVDGIKGIFDIYNYALSLVNFIGPTCFAPILRKIMEHTKKAFKDDPDNYSFFLLITDGEIHDMQDTIDALVEASTLPLSIVIVGVGNQGTSTLRQTSAT